MRGRDRGIYTGWADCLSLIHISDFVNKFAAGGTKKESPVADAIQDAVDVIEKEEPETEAE